MFTQSYRNYLNIKYSQYLPIVDSRIDEIMEAPRQSLCRKRLEENCLLCSTLRDSPKATPQLYDEWKKGLPCRVCRQVIYMSSHHYMDRVSMCCECKQLFNKYKFLPNQARTIRFNRNLAFLRQGKNSHFNKLPIQLVKHIEEYINKY